jgi:hypothetical protein
MLFKLDLIRVTKVARMIGIIRVAWRDEKYLTITLIIIIFMVGKIHRPRRTITNRAARTENAPNHQ